MCLCLCAGEVFAQDNNDPVDSDPPSCLTGISLEIHQDTTNDIGNLSGNSAFGNNNYIRGNRSLAIGDRNTIVRYTEASFAFGADNYMSGSFSACLGRNDSVTGSGSFALGRYLSQRGSSNAFLVGSGIAADARLACDSANRLVVGFLSTRPTFTVIAASNDYGHGVTDKTGRVAIGDVASPQAKLHLRSDAGEDAVLLIEPGQPAVNKAVLRLKDSFHRLLVDEDGAMELSAGSHPLSLGGDNFSVDGSQLTLGAMMEPRLVLYTDDYPAIYSNALPSRDAMNRPIEAPSYAVEFGSNALLFRTAAYQIPRDGDTDATGATDAIDNWSDALSLGTNGRITLNGRVGVNTENTYSDYALAVNGGIIATRVRVKFHDDWPDYVFDEGRTLMPLEELECYIARHRHLPGVPSAMEAAADGIDLGQTQAALLEKIEELTLHVIALQKRVAELEGRQAGDTVRFTYDACGNRTGRTIAFSRALEDPSGRSVPGGDSEEEWLAEVSEAFGGYSVSLFPNPTEGRFTLSLNGGIGPDATAVLLTTTGTVLETRTLKGTAEVFDLSAKPAGLYLLRLSTGKETRTWKIVKRN